MYSLSMFKQVHNLHLVVAKLKKKCTASYL